MPAEGSENVYICFPFLLTSFRFLLPQKSLSRRAVPEGRIGSPEKVQVSPASRPRSPRAAGRQRMPKSLRIRKNWFLRSNPHHPGTAPLSCHNWYILETADCRTYFFIISIQWKYAQSQPHFPAPLVEFFTKKQSSRKRDLSFRLRLQCPCDHAKIRFFLHIFIDLLF